MKKPAPSTKWSKPNRPAPIPDPHSQRNRMAAVMAIVALIVCAGLGIALAVKKPTAPRATIASVPEEAEGQIPTAAPIRVMSPTHIKNDGATTKAKRITVEELTVFPREVVAGKDFWTFRDPEDINHRPRNNVIAKLPEVEAPSVQHGMMKLGTGIPFHTDFRAACDEGHRLNHLVFVVEFVGLFQDGDFSSKAADVFLKSSMRKKPIIDYLLGGKKKMGFTPALRNADSRHVNGDHVIVYMCQPDGIVLHAMIDPSDEQLHKEIHWLEHAHDRARKPDKGREIAYLDQIKAAHLRASQDDDHDGGKHAHRLHEMLAKAPLIDELDEWIWKLLLK